MPQVYNVYCDESCHLEHDNQVTMVLGAVWCPLEKTREIATRLREIKTQHGLSPNFEIKWVKVSPAKLDFYQEIIDYFFDDDDLHFRALIIPDKTKLRHAEFNQTHEEWYYKMFFDLLKIIIVPTSSYRIYLDIKDTRSAAKIRKLHEVLIYEKYDFDREIIKKIQNIRSNEVEQAQLADLLIGTVGYVNRGKMTSSAKNMMVERMQNRSGYLLTRTTLPQEDKVNIFCWHPREAQV